MRGYARVARRRFFALRDHATAWPGAAWSWVCKFVANWWTEIRAFCLPLVIVFLAICSPDIGLPVSSGASIAAIVAVQAAVTGLSLIALVLAVEVARRQEDRDDAVYEIMLRSAWIRPTFLFAIAALLATLVTIAIGDFSVDRDAMPSANLLLSAYVLTGAVGAALLATVLRTMSILRPTQIFEYRRHASELERADRVREFINSTRPEYVEHGAVENLIRPMHPLSSAQTERLFRGTDDSVSRQDLPHFQRALEDLRALVTQSANEIADSDPGFQAPGRPKHGYWYPLDAINSRIRSLWAAALRQPGDEFVQEMWSFGYWIIMSGVERRAGEILETGLQSGLASYAAAREAGRVTGHARYEWINLGSAAWWRVYPLDSADDDHTAGPFVARLVEHLQEYGNMLLEADDSASLRDVIAEFSQDFFERAQGRWRSRPVRPDDTVAPPIVEYAQLALLALAGRAITLQEHGRLSSAQDLIDRVDEMISASASIERLIPAAFQQDLPLHRQWTRWEWDAADRDATTAIPIAPEQYVMAPLLVRLLRSGSTDPLPPLGGHAQRFIDAWMSHKDVILELAGIAAAEREEATEGFMARLTTAKTAEEREREDVYIDASIDRERKSRFLTNLRLWRQNDRVLETCFQQVNRVRLLDEDKWGSDGRLAQGWLLPRPSFVGDVIPASVYAEWHDERLVRGFEQGLASMMLARVEDSSDVREVPSADLAHLLAAIDVALTALGAGRQLIVFVGNWPGDVHSSLRRRMYERNDEELLPLQRQHYQVTGAYKGHWILWFQTDGEPAIAVVNLERWGWLVRAPVNGEDFGVGLDGIDQTEAEAQARNELPDDRDDVARAGRARQLRLLVRAHAEERTRFEVENPGAARIIRVAASSDDSAHSAA